LVGRRKEDYSRCSSLVSGHLAGVLGLCGMKRTVGI
jgi:hypothetical protein